MKPEPKDILFYGHGPTSEVPAPDPEHRAKDHKINQVFSALTGRNVVMDVMTADGRLHVDRMLCNVSVVPGRGNVPTIKGWDPDKKAVRQFSVDKICRIEVL